MKSFQLAIHLAVLLFAASQAAAQSDNASGIAIGANPPNLAQEAARDYRDRARFPAWSQPVPAGMPDPVLGKRQPTRQSLPHQDGEQLTVWASGIVFEQNQTVTLYARLDPVSGKDDGPPRPTRNRQLSDGWTVTGVIAERAMGELGEFTYRDDGTGPDQRAGDGVFTARFTLPEFARPEIGEAENLAVFVTAEHPDSDTLKAVGGILYSHPAAELTGQFEDQAIDGDLVIRAEVEVHAAGRFHLAGTLNSMNGTSLVTGQAARELEPGRHWMELTFYGLALSERGADGPYSLGSVSLTTANGIPNALGPMLENAHMTRPYPAETFHMRSFDRPDLLEAAARLEQAAARRAGGSK